MRPTRWLLVALLCLGACDASPNEGGEPAERATRDLGPSGLGGSSGTDGSPPECQPVPDPDAKTVRSIELNHLSDKRAAWSETETLSEPLSPAEAWKKVDVGADEVVAAALRTSDGSIVDAKFVSSRCRYEMQREEPRTLTVPTLFPSIQEALEAAQAGDTVQVLAGTYREHLQLKSGVRLIGAGARETILDGAGEGENLIDFTDARDAVVSGFTLRNVGQREGCADPTDPLLCSGHWYAAGVYADGHAWEDSDPCNDPSIYFNDNIVIGNDVGMMLYFHPYAVVRNNVFVNNRVGFVANHHGGSSTLLVRNTFYTNTDLAIGVSASFLDILNNVFVDNGQVLRQEYCQQGRLRCNVLWQNGALGDREFSADDGNLSVDPLFSAESYGLDPASPAFHTVCEGEPEPPPISSTDGCNADPIPVVPESF